MKTILKLGFMLILTTLLISCSDNETDDLAGKQSLIVTDDLAGKTIYPNNFSEIDFSGLSIGQFVYVDNSPAGFENSVKVKVERTEDGIGIYKPNISQNLSEELSIDFKANNELISQISVYEGTNLDILEVGEDGGIVPILLHLCCVKVQIWSNGNWTWVWSCTCLDA